MMMLRLVALSFMAFILSGCAHGNKEPQEKTAHIETSKEVHLSPVKENQKTIYVQVRNRTADDDFKLENKIKHSLRRAGYLVVTVPDKAHYLLEINILALTQNDLKKMQSIYDEGYGEIIDRESLKNIDPELAEKTAKAWFNDKQNYAALLDVRISELSKTAVIEGNRSSDQNALRAYFNNVSHWTRYPLRMIATVKQADNYFVARDLLIQKINQKLMTPFTAEQE